MYATKRNQSVQLAVTYKSSINNRYLKPFKLIQCLTVEHSNEKLSFSRGRFDWQDSFRSTTFQSLACRLDWR